MSEDAAAENLIRSIQGSRVFVTGGSGFIGRAVCRHLLESEAEVLNFDLKPWPGPHPAPQTVIGDIEDADALGGACRSFDPSVFIHLAAFASLEAPTREDFSSIWNGTRVAALAFAESTRPERFVNISTQMVIRPGPQPSDLRDYDPYTPYGEAKAEAERMLDDLDRPYAVAHVRPTTIWGPYHPGFAETVMLYLDKGWYLHPSTSTPILRTYGYVDNCAGQIVSVAFSPTVTNGDIFYGGDVIMDAGQFLDAMSIALRGKPVRRFPYSLLRRAGEAGTLLRRMGVPFPLDRERVMRMSTDYHPPIAAMRQLMAFPYVPFDIGMQRAAQWFREIAGSR